MHFVTFNEIQKWAKAHTGKQYHLFYHLSCHNGTVKQSQDNATVTKYQFICIIHEHFIFYLEFPGEELSPTLIYDYLDR